MPNPPIPLWPSSPPAYNPDDPHIPWLERYPVDSRTPRGAVIVCPGGGYSNRAPHEAEPVARAFNAAGIHGFVVHYRTVPSRYPAALLDAARAVRLVRANAAEWNVDPARIAILGFSAGGHAAANLGVHHADPDALAHNELDAISARPDGLILCYPVISGGEFAHQGSFENLLGPDATAEMRKKMSLELRVDAETPPTFLWHTFDDGSVPVENSLLFAQALRNQGTPFELHIYPHAPHGVGLSPEDPHVATWMELCQQWLIGMGWA
jgi:acetyl esterase/lipase